MIGCQSVWISGSWHGRSHFRSSSQAVCLVSFGEQGFDVILDTLVVPLFPFYSRFSLLKLNIMEKIEKGDSFINGVLRNLESGTGESFPYRVVLQEFVAKGFRVGIWRLSGWSALV